jgi:hypothetical protein
LIFFDRRAEMIFFFRLAPCSHGKVIFRWILKMAAINIECDDAWILYLKSGQLRAEIKPNIEPFSNVTDDCTLCYARPGYFASRTIHVRHYPPKTNVIMDCFLHEGLIHTYPWVTSVEEAAKIVCGALSPEEVDKVGLVVMSFAYWHQNKNK